MTIRANFTGAVGMTIRSNFTGVVGKTIRSKHKTEDFILVFTN